jgi:hypothetical protein
MTFTCKICNTELDLDKCQVFMATCFLTKVPLKRFKCTVCGVIFGTLDMLACTPEQMKKDYIFCDTVFKDTNSVYYETQTFMSLKPNKNGLYLNFGCGYNCTTIPTLRGLGWEILGYEPYVPGPNPGSYILQNRQDLLKCKFDGIISNNLLEHLQDPVQDLLFMKSLLKDKTSLMAHSTANYKYLYEYSKYHLYFFVDKSVDYMCQGAGLTIKEMITGDVEYINYVYSQKQKSQGTNVQV